MPEKTQPDVGTTARSLPSGADYAGGTRVRPLAYNEVRRRESVNKTCDLPVHDESTVDVDRLTGDLAGSLRGQKCHHVRDV